jgi:hypothetical protein
MGDVTAHPARQKDAAARATMAVGTMAPAYSCGALQQETRAAKPTDDLKLPSVNERESIGGARAERVW